VSLVGKPLPAFEVQDQEGRTVTAKDLRGAWTVLYAYPKDLTPGCTTESCDFRDAWPRLTQRGVKVYGISRDGAALHQKFIAKHDLPFPLLSDPDKALLAPLGAFGKKLMYGKEVEGIIRSTFLIDPKGVIRAVWPKVSVKGHVGAVLDRLEDLSQ
jgi:peroxiredoxin Q/BCP